MKTMILGTLALLLLGGVEHNQDITGIWQGTLQAGRDLRTVLKISKGENGGYKVVLYSIDQGGQPIAANAASLEGSTFKYSITAIGGSYEGKLSADDSTIVGTWTQGPKPLPLTLTRANADTAWEIPKPPVPMAADANPKFEVATVKPSKPDTPGKAFTVRGKQIITINTTLDDVIEFAYGVQMRQIVGGPDWMDKDKFDIAGMPDREGLPSVSQAKSMLQKLMADRFKLTFHHDKKELAVYALTVGKNGPKLTKNESGGTLPGLFFRPAPGGIMLPGVNATMGDFVGVMQAAVLDRPVVDQTGLKGRFDFQLTWAPDDSQFGGHPPKQPQSDNSAPVDNPPPGLFTAIQEQLGLKLEATKAPADVFIIDHVEKPSEN